MKAKLKEFKHLQISMDDFIFLETIGSGAFGSVVKAKHIQSKKIFAIKQFFTPVDKLSFIREVTSLSSTKDPFLLRIVGFSLKDFSIVTEFLPNKDLSSQIPFLNPSQKTIIALGIAKGISSLHKNGILHCDVKGLNVFLDEYFYPKIGDLGSSRKISSKKEKNTIGTTAWMAPEIMNEKSFEPASDVYSYGITLYEMLTGEHPFSKMKSHYEMMKVVLNGERPKIPEEAPKKLKKLIEACWETNPKKRPTFGKIIEKFIRNKIVFPGGNWEEVWKEVSKFFRKTIIWRDTHKENRAYIKQIKGMYGEYIHFCSVEDDRILHLIEDKENTWIITNRVNDGRKFLVQCRENGIKNQMLVFSGNIKNWETMDGVDVCNEWRCLFNFIKKYVVSSKNYVIPEQILSV